MVRRKNWTAIFMGAAFVLCLAGCGNIGNAPSSVASDTAAAGAGTNTEAGGTNLSGAESSGETVQQTEGQTSDTEGDRILIAYFSAGENSEVDVVSSASVTMIDGEAKGRLRVVADMIQAETRGDLFSIQTSVEYPADGGELIDYAAVEQDENARPELTSHIDNLEDYDTIFIGFAGGIIGLN